MALASEREVNPVNQQRAPGERANRILEQLGGTDQIERTRGERQVPPNSSATGDSSQNEIYDTGLRHNPRLEPVSVYKSLCEETKLLRHESNLDWEITGGSDMPTVYARVPTLSEVQALQRRTWHLENEILLREKSCRICNKAFGRESSKVRIISLQQ